MGDLCDVNVTGSINCDSIRLSQLSVPAFCPDACNVNSVWREFLYSPIVSIGDKDVSPTIDCKAPGVVKLTLSTSLSALEGGHRRLRQIHACEVCRSRLWNLINDEFAISIFLVFVDFWKIPNIKIFVGIPD